MYETKNQQRPGPWFNIKMSSYQYRKSHCGDKTVVRSSYLHNGISYTGKMGSLYWIGALIMVDRLMGDKTIVLIFTLYSIWYWHVDILCFMMLRYRSSWELKWQDHLSGYGDLFFSIIKIRRWWGDNIYREPPPSQQVTTKANNMHNSSKVLCVEMAVFVIACFNGEYISRYPAKSVSIDGRALLKGHHRYNHHNR